MSSSIVDILKERIDSLPSQFRMLKQPHDGVSMFKSKIYEGVIYFEAIGSAKEYIGSSTSTVAEYIREQLLPSFQNVRGVFEEEVEAHLIGENVPVGLFKVLDFRRGLLERVILKQKNEFYYPELCEVIDELWKENLNKTLEFASNLTGPISSDKIEWTGDREEFYKLFCKLIVEGKFKTNGSSVPDQLYKAFASHFKLKLANPRTGYLAENSVYKGMGTYQADEKLLRDKK